MQTFSPNLAPIAKNYKNAVVMPFVAYGMENFMASWDFLRFFGGVYTNQGEPIPDALLVRAFENRGNLNYHRVFQAEYQAPYIAPSQKLSGDYIFCGPLFPMFGHFILESLARIWYAKTHSEATLVWTAAQDYLPWQKEILDILEITNEAVFIQSPTRFESLVIPSAGHILPDFFAPYYFDSLAVVQPKPIVPGKKLYVSRSDMTLSGGFTNERAIEQYLQTHGWTVFRLHEHPVSARFDELSSAEVILSIEGAGFLSFLFFQNIIHSKIFSLARNDNKRFNNDMMFNDIFETISKAKSLKHARLDIPKTYKTGSGFNSRFELDINVFRDLMKNTDFLSHESDDLQRFITRIDNIDDNAAQSRQLITTIQDILTTDCPPERVHCYKSGLFESQGNLDTAIAELKKSIAIQSNNSQTHARLARLLMEKGDFHQAVVAQKTAMALDEEDHPHFHIKLSHLYVQIHELDQAIAEAQTAIRMDESNPYLFQLYHHLGAVLLQKPDWTGAEKALDKAIALNSTFPDAHFLLSHIYAHNGKLNDAVEKAQTATQLRDDQPDFHHHLGNLLMHMRQWDAAEGAHAKALELKPDFLAAKQQLAVIRTRKSQSKH